MKLTPFSFKERIMVKMCSISTSVKDAVGSSMMMTRAFFIRARAISTTCL